MADVVRLSIVYETQQAASRLNSLNGKLGSVHTSSRKVAIAALNLAQAMQTGSISVSALGNRLALLGGKLGAVGLGLAVVAGIFLLVKKNSDAARAQTEKFADQLRTTKRAIDDLLRVGFKSEFRAELEQISDQILILDRDLSKQRMNLLERWFGSFKLPSIKRFLFGGEDPQTRGQRNRLQGQADQLTPERERTLISDRASFDQNITRRMGRLLQGSALDAMATAVDRAKQELHDLVVAGLDPTSEQARAMAASIRQGEEALRHMTRAANLMRSGLQTIADALEEFVVTGTASFTDFLNNILRLLYKDFTGSLIDSVLRGAGALHPGGSAGSAGLGAVPAPGPINQSAGGITSNVNFTINTLDAQGVATFIQQHGATIAAEVTRQAGRSTGMRRMLRHG